MFNINRKPNSIVSKIVINNIMEEKEKWQGIDIESTGPVGIQFITVRCRSIIR